MIIFWCFPVAFVGIISNIYTVCSTAVFLAWICTLPPVVVGIISSRFIGYFTACVELEYTGLELSLMIRFFIFQVFYSFLVVTLSSGIIASLNSILNNPTSIPATLAHGLPQASTFFFIYLLLQGLSGVAGGFLQIVPLGNEDMEEFGYAPL